MTGFIQLALRLLWDQIQIATGAFIPLSIDIFIPSSEQLLCNDFFSPNLHPPLYMQLVLRMAAAARTDGICWNEPQRKTILFFRMLFESSRCPFGIIGLRSFARSRNGACRRRRAYRCLFWLWMCTFPNSFVFFLFADE